jgi:hypothetical protein
MTSLGTGSDPTSVAAVVDLHPDPDPLTPTTGLKLARRIERSADLMRQLRRRVKKSLGRGRKKTSRQLTHVFDLLQAIQHDILAGGTFHEQQVRDILDHTDTALAPFSERKRALKTKHLKLLRHALRDLTQAFESLVR